MKGYIQRWVNKKYEVVIVVDMKEVLEFYGGVRGCRIVVVEVDVVKVAKLEEWKGISVLVNFEFFFFGIRVWKVYGVGEGQMFLYDEEGRLLQGLIGFYIIMFFTFRILLLKFGLLMVKAKDINL